MKTFTASFVVLGLLASPVIAAEYDYKSVVYADPPTEQELNYFAQDGWNLKQIVSGKDAYHVYFEREALVREEPKMTWCRHISLSNANCDLLTKSEIASLPLPMVSCVHDPAGHSVFDAMFDGPKTFLMYESYIRTELPSGEFRCEPYQVGNVTERQTGNEPVAYQAPKYSKQALESWLSGEACRLAPGEAIGDGASQGDLGCKGSDDALRLYGFLTSDTLGKDLMDRARACYVSKGAPQIEIDRTSHEDKWGVIFGCQMPEGSMSLVVDEYPTPVKEIVE